MSILWMDDPSFYATAQLISRYTLAGSGLAVEAAQGRFGGNAWGASNTGTSVIRRTVATAVTGTQGFSFKWCGATTTSIIVSFFDSGSTQLDVRVTGAGQLIVTRNGTQIGSTSTNSLIQGVWSRIEFKTTIDPTAGVIEVRVNGSSTGWIPSTGSLNTRATANTSFNGIQIGGQCNSATHNYFNDWFYTDSNSPNADFLGDKRCFLRLPSANSSVAWTNNWASDPGASQVVALGQQFKDTNGNVQQCTVAGTTGSGARPTWATTGGSITNDGATVKWVCVGSGSNPGTANWMAVSEPVPDDDSSYNSDSTPGDIDLFAYPNLPAGAQNIAAVNNVIRARKDDAGTRSIESWMSSSGTTQGSATVALSTTYAFVDLIQETDPHTGSGWTASGVNAMLAGYKEIA